jgi:hypothetical protein
MKSEMTAGTLVSRMTKALPQHTLFRRLRGTQDRLQNTVYMFWRYCRFILISNIHHVFYW